MTLWRNLQGYFAAISVTKPVLSFTEALEAHNISVWVDFVGLNAGVDFLNKIGQAIIDSKVRGRRDRRGRWLLSSNG